MTLMPEGSIIASIANQAERWLPRLWEFIVSIPGFIQGHIGWIRLGFIIAGVVLAVAIVLVHKKGMRELRDFKGLTTRDLMGLGSHRTERHLAAWREIEEKIKTEEREELKAAVIEANQLFARLLEIIGYPGRNLEERLERVTSAQFSNIIDLRRAYDVAEGLAQNPAQFITRDGAERVIEAYRQVFQELGVIPEE